MPLLDVHMRAICRIISGDNVPPRRRGTGFLIDSTHVLTAFHVVGNRKANTLDAGPIRLAFGPRTPSLKPWSTTVMNVATQVRGDAKDDWAILTLSEPAPASIAPLLLGTVPRGYLIRWTTWGFSDAAPDVGFAYDGTITGLGLELQLFAQQAIEEQASQVRGLSGSPCVVDGTVVGIIIAASDPTGEGYAAGGAVIAVPMTVVASKCSEAKLPALSPPFVPEVAGYLGSPRLRFLLPDTAARLGLSADGIEDVRLPAHVAGRLLAGGIDTTVDHVLQLGDGLDRADMLRILDCAGSLWVDATAASAIEEEATSGAFRTIGLNVGRVDSAARYVHRAGYARARHPGWRQYALQLLPPKPERQLRGLIDGVTNLLRQKFQCADGKKADPLPSRRIHHVLESLREHPHDQRPIFILVPPPVPVARNIARLKRAFRQVNFIFLLGAPVTEETRAAYPGLRIIEPLLGDDVESRILANYQRRRTEIETFFQKPELTE